MPIPPVLPDEDPPEEEEFIPAAEAETVDSASQEGLRQQTRRQKRAANQTKDFWRKVFADPIGRREIWGLLNDDMHAFTAIFPAGPVGFPDELAAYYRRGEQDMGLRLYHRWMALQPDAIRQMHLENDPRFAKPRRRRTPQVG